MGSIFGTWRDCRCNIISSWANFHLQILHLACFDFGCVGFDVTDFPLSFLVFSSAVVDTVLSLVLSTFDFFALDSNSLTCLLSDVDQLSDELASKSRSLLASVSLSLSIFMGSLLVALFNSSPLHTPFSSIFSSFFTRCSLICAALEIISESHCSDAQPWLMWSSNQSSAISSRVFCVLRHIFFLKCVSTWAFSSGLVGKLNTQKSQCSFKLWWAVESPEKGNHWKL